MRNSRSARRMPGPALVRREHPDPVALAIEELREMSCAVGKRGLAEHHSAARLLDPRERRGEVVAGDDVHRGRALARLVAFALDQAAAVLTGLAGKAGETVRPEA